MMEKSDNKLMNTDREKANAFIKRLMANPALSKFPILQREEQIIQFLKLNANQLYPTLSSQNFFYGKNWDYIWKLLLKSLIEESNSILFPRLERIIKETIDFGFLSFLENRSWDFPAIREEIFTFLKRLFIKLEARRSFVGPFNSLSLNLTDRYIDESFERKEYIYFELTKVQKLTMSKEEIKNFTKASLLLKVAIHLLTVDNATEMEGIQSGVVHPQFVEKAFTILANQLKHTSPALLKSALNSNLSFIENKSIEATARLAAIFSARGKNYMEIKKIERGADTPDKSWFNIARRNYKFYGFDINMLDELYKIAAENGW